MIVIKYHWTSNKHSGYDYWRGVYLFGFIPLLVVHIGNRSFWTELDKAIKGE